MQKNLTLTIPNDLNWQYCNPVKFHFGSGSVNCLPQILGGRKSVLITTPGFTQRGVTSSIKNLLAELMGRTFDQVMPNPTFESVKSAYKEVKEDKFEAIIALGGGSTIDTAKAVSSLIASDSENWLEDHLKDSCPIPKKFNPIPVIAIPTTAGTGSEVTSFATIWDMEAKKKYSLSHPKNHPSDAVLDPELTLTLPENETIVSGLDALSHSMESIWNKQHNPISDTYALSAISIVLKTLYRLKLDLSNIEYRSQMLYASLLAGLAFSNTRTALAHSISYPITANFGIPHGLACSIPLPALLKVNGERAFDRVSIMSEAFETEKKLEPMVLKLVEFYTRIGVSSSLLNYGIEKSQSQLIFGSSLTKGRAENNIVDIDENELLTIIQSLF